MPEYQAQRYLRRCNNRPTDGIEISREDVEHQLSLARAIQGSAVHAIAVEGDLETGLTLHHPAGRPWEVETPGTKPRTFTYTPLAAGQHRAPAEPV